MAVGSYDGAIVVYDCSATDTAGTLVKTLEGPSDVEWCCFHPKGGTVSPFLLFTSCVCFVWLALCCFALSILSRHVLSCLDST